MKVTDVKYKKYLNCCNTFPTSGPSVKVPMLSLHVGGANEPRYTCKVQTAISTSSLKLLPMTTSSSAIQSYNTNLSIWVFSFLLFLYKHVFVSVFLYRPKYVLDTCNGGTTVYLYLVCHALK